MFSLNLGLAEQSKLKFRIKRDVGLSVVVVSLLLSVEPFEKFIVVEGGWWSRVSLVLSLTLKLNNSVKNRTITE